MTLLIVVGQSSVHVYNILEGLIWFGLFINTSPDNLGSSFLVVWLLPMIFLLLFGGSFLAAPH